MFVLADAALWQTLNSLQFGQNLFADRSSIYYCLAWYHKIFSDDSESLGILPWLQNSRLDNQTYRSTITGQINVRKRLRGEKTQNGGCIAIGLKLVWSFSFPILLGDFCSTTRAILSCELSRNTILAIWARLHNWLFPILLETEIHYIDYRQVDWHIPK